MPCGVGILCYLEPETPDTQQCIIYSLSDTYAQSEQSLKLTDH